MGKHFEVLWDDTLPSPRAATATQPSRSQHPSPWHRSPMPPPAGPDHPLRNPPLAPLLPTTPRALPRSPPCLCSALSHQVSLAGAPQGDMGSDKPSSFSGQVPSMVVVVTFQTHWVPGILTPLLGKLKLPIPSHPTEPLPVSVLITWQHLAGRGKWGRESRLALAPAPASPRGRAPLPGASLCQGLLLARASVSVGCPGTLASCLAAH